LRIATYNVEMNRAGPGLLLRDLQKGEDPAIAAAVQVIAALGADVLLLTGFDYDLDQVALGAFADELAAAGAAYSYRLSLRPNTGQGTGLDLDGDGYLGGPGDAQGYGRFSGEGGMAVLSKLPIRAGEVRDFSEFLWRDLPGALLFDGMTAEALAVQRLSTTGHWDVPLELPGGGVLHLLAWSATPPVFDGVEDRNGRRNHDEARFWGALLDGGLPMPAPEPPFVVIGVGNLDVSDGDGLAAGMMGLLQHPALQDVAPRGTSGRVEAGHLGDAGLDTADFSAKGGPGGLRVDYVLPSRDMAVVAAGVMWPDAGDALAGVVATASRHRPVWVDVTLP
jgi:Endonuclease/Exonuclease/phosphatase family